jgi:hypothetical protein
MHCEVNHIISPGPQRPVRGPTSHKPEEPPRRAITSIEPKQVIAGIALSLEVAPSKSPKREARSPEIFPLPFHLWHVGSLYRSFSLPTRPRPQKSSLWCGTTFQRERSLWRAVAWPQLGYQALPPFAAERFVLSNSTFVGATSTKNAPHPSLSSGHKVLTELPPEFAAHYFHYFYQK